MSLLDEVEASLLHHWLGAQVTSEGVQFRVWAPRAKSVSVVGDFNSWNGEAHSMSQRNDVWELLVPEAQPGQRYKFAVCSQSGQVVHKTDPFSKAIECPPATASIIVNWKPVHSASTVSSNPMTIYELHLGSWKAINGERPTFRSIAKPLIAYLLKLNITHVEFMPITHHPFYGSWGYQCLGYFAPLGTYGSLDDLVWLLEQLHDAGFGCILDWVPAHFPMDEGGLIRFDGEPLFEHADPRRGFHPDWNTAIFDLERPEVRAFLLSSARFWLEDVGFDGLRVDAVSSMLYLNYSREEGAWLPNQHGGHENLDALQFFGALHSMVQGLSQPHYLIAEEATAWPKVSFSPETGGVGFDYKWDMGWMHDTLRYLSREPVYRVHHYDELLFRGVYAFHEHFVLALSHDEVVHGKGSLIRKLPGDEWQRFANCRLLFAMMIAQPGKKMIFMGMEFGQEPEWNHDDFLDWNGADGSFNQGLTHCYSQLNRLYREESALQNDWPTGLVHHSHRDPQNSVLLLIRQNEEDGACIVALFNCTPNPLMDYEIGVPRMGTWTECFNTDEISFGGSGLVAQYPTVSTPRSVHGFENSVRVGIPPLGASFWKWEGNS